jgi:aspartate racemase
MKKLGLIGGTGPESTLLYYRKFVYEANKRGRYLLFPLTIESINVYNVLDMCARQEYVGLIDYLLQAIQFDRGRCRGDCLNRQYTTHRL